MRSQQRDKPFALYIIGAQGAGKTSICKSSRFRHWLRKVADVDIQKDVSVIDGELFVGPGFKLCSVHKATKPAINAWKFEQFSNSVESRKCMLLPVTGTSMFADQASTSTLRERGYQIHVLHLVVSFEHSQRYTAIRAQRTGRPLADLDTFVVTSEISEMLKAEASGVMMVAGNEDFQFESQLDL